MTEGFGTTPDRGRKIKGYSARPHEQLPVFPIERRDRNVPREIPPPPRTPSVARDPIVPPTPIARPAPPPEPLVTPPEPARPQSRPELFQKPLSQKVAIGAGVGILGVLSAPLAAAAAVTYGAHKVADYASTFVANALYKKIMALKKFNPFSKVWNWLIGNKGGSSHHGHGDSHGHGSSHGHGHGGAHDHGHGHGHH